MVSAPTLRGFIENVVVPIGPDFVTEVNAELKSATDERLIVIFELILSTLWREPKLGQFLIEQRTLDYFRLPEYSNRLIWAVTAYQPRAFPSDVFFNILTNAPGCNPVTIIQAVAYRFTAFDPLSDDIRIFAHFLSLAKVLTRNGGAPSYVQLLYFMFITHPDVCRSLEESFLFGLIFSLLSNHPRAVRSVYLLYSLSDDIVWPIEDSPLLEHLKIREVRYAVLSYLIRKYTPNSRKFVRPLLRISGEYQMAGIVLCRMLKNEPSLGRKFIFNSMSYLLEMDPRIAIRLLCLLCINQEGRVIISRFSAIYSLLAEYVKLFPQWAVDISGILCKFPVNADCAWMIVRSGLLEQLNVAAFSRGIRSTIPHVLAVHAMFDQYALPRDRR
jgi:hypothetical protein